MRGVKKITEKSSWWKTKTVSTFDEKGFLLNEIVFKIKFWNNEIQSNYEYEYIISDTLLEIKSESKIFHNYEKNTYSIYKYYYNNFKQCYKVEMFHSKKMDMPFIFIDNFMYNDNKIQSYKWHRNNFDYKTMLYKNTDTDLYKYSYANNDKQQTIEQYSILCDSVVNYRSISILIYKKDKITDFIRKSAEAIVSGEPCWNNKTNKVHIKYSDFDKRGNWTKSYFITEKGKVFRSKRKIEYW